MDCPRCGAHTTDPLPSCPGCGLTMDALSQHLGSSLVKLEALTDAANCLRVAERDFLQRELADFQRRFPQVFFAVYLGVLPAAPSPPEIAFWLLNHAGFEPADPGRLNEYAALLIIDPVAKRAGMTVGYGLDRHLPRPKLEALLRRLRTPLWHGEFAEAIRLAVLHLDKALRRAAHRTDRLHEFPAPDSASDFFRTAGLQSLRKPGAARAMHDPTHH